jgi:hypothetical protein
MLIHARGAARKVESECDYLAARLAYGLAITTAGILLSAPEGIAMDTEALLPAIRDFDIGAAVERFRMSA